MLVLGVETSCDETGMALCADGRILGEALASQVELHTLFGGVVPELASREHVRLLAPLFSELSAKTGLSTADLDGVAVARGPGLLGCLLVGLGFAKGLAISADTKLLGVDHLAAHLLAPGLETRILFPALGLLVSGGHTHLYHMRSAYDFELLGRTLDDAAGEAFDKVAKLLNLPYPGGRIIDELSREGSPDQGLFPRPYLDNDNLDFSFSGLKTAVAKYVSEHPELRLPAMPLPGEELAGRLPGDMRAPLADMLASFTHAVCGALAVKARRALARTPGVRCLVLAGGVAANSALRRTMAGVAEEAGLPLVAPSPALCTDNASMIAYAGELFLAAGYAHDLSLEAVPRGRRVPRDYAAVPDFLNSEAEEERQHS